MKKWQPPPGEASEKPMAKLSVANRFGGSGTLRGSSRLGISLEPADFQVPNVSVFGGGRNFPDKLDGNGEKSRNL